MPYIIVKKDYRIFCLSYTDNCATDLYEYLYLTGWRITKTVDMKVYLDKWLPGVGRIQTFAFTANTQIKL